MTTPRRLRAGDVILLFDGTIRPPKHKRFICVVAQEGWLLRINSQRHFRPHLPVLATDAPGWLDHDSFVELRGIIEHDTAEITESLALGDSRVLGCLSPAIARALTVAVQAAATFTPNDAAAIIAALEAEYGQQQA